MRPHPRHLFEDPVLRSAVQRDLAGPLAALRAALESLAREAGRPAQRGPLLRRALAEVVRLERRVEALAEIVGPAELHPAACTVEEIARSALRALTERDRGRVWLALEQGDRRVDVDAATLSRALSALLEETLRRGPRDLLLHSCCDTARVAFTIIDDLSATGCELSDPEKASEDSLELLLSKREAQRLGGTVEVCRVTNEHWSTRLEIPLGPRGAA